MRRYTESTDTTTQSLKMRNAAIDSIYGPAAHSLVDHLDFLTTRQTGISPTAWNVVVDDSGVSVIVPLASTVEAKEKFETLNHTLNFRKAVQRSIEAMSSVGCTAEDCPALWEAATKLANSQASKPDSA
ncbi:hypothetical protein [Pseudomonas saponiphila]|nr:hypothetical protein [Pseudomonas saponiphila]